MEDYQLITPVEGLKTQGSWKLPPLYKENARGKNTIWQIGFDGVDHLIMTFGEVGGKIRTTTVEIIPKAKRTVQEQAFLEAFHRYNQKIDKDRYSLEGEEAPEIPQPMLANTWIPDKTKIKYPVIAQPKLDGIRCLAYLRDDKIELRSRNNKPFFFLDHLRERIKIFLTFLPKGSILDGELYSFVLSFNDITSIVRQQKKPHEREITLDYFIFDLILPENPSFQERYQLLLDAYYAYSEAGYLSFDEAGNVDDPLRLVASAEAKSKEELLALHDSYVREGYEGLIIRKSDAPYTFGRGSNLLKYKEFQDEEGEIVGVEEATGTEKGTALVLVQDPRGHVVSVRFRAPFEERRRWLENPDLIIHKLATVRFQELTPEGVWRFPVGISIRDYE